MLQTSQRFHDSLPAGHQASNSQERKGPLQSCERAYSNVYQALPLPFLSQHTHVSDPKTCSAHASGRVKFCYIFSCACFGYCNDFQLSIGGVTGATPGPEQSHDPNSLRPPKGDYRIPSSRFHAPAGIADFTPDYSWAIASDRLGGNGVILTRDQIIEDARYNAVLKRAKWLGVDTTKSARTIQAPPP